MVSWTRGRDTRDPQEPPLKPLRRARQMRRARIPSYLQVILTRSHAQSADPFIFTMDRGSSGSGSTHLVATGWGQASFRPRPLGPPSGHQMNGVPPAGLPEAPLAATRFETSTGEIRCIFRVDRGPHLAREGAPQRRPCDDEAHAASENPFIFTAHRGSQR